MREHRVWPAFLVASACAIAATSLAAQSTGNVSGTVTTASGAPLVDALVFIPDTGIGTLTNSAGRFLLLNVSPGTYELHAELIGHRSQSTTITVTGGTTATAGFRLTQVAIDLDEIVVTGTGVATERRRLGNTVATVDAQSLENAPIQDVSALLQGREPGVVSHVSGGHTGAGARIRIRGSASVSQNNEPIVYVDGVRIDTDAQYLGTGGQASASRIDDISPESIDRIEILKGAAAATLYGSEASNGVIQIFTKRGTANQNRFTAHVEQTAISMPTGRIPPLADFPANLCFSNQGCIDSNTQRMAERWGVRLAPFEVYDRDISGDLLESGYAQNYSASLSGGSGALTYFLSARVTDEDGPWGAEDLGPATDTDQRRQGTANLSFATTDDVTLGLTMMFTEADHSSIPNGNDIQASPTHWYFSQLRLANENNLYGSPAFATLRETMQQIHEQASSNFTTSLNVNARLGAGIVLDGTVGLNSVSERTTSFRPFGWNVDGFSNLEDRRFVADRNHRRVSFDVKGAHAEGRIAENFTLTSSVGIQGYISEDWRLVGVGFLFPGPGLGTVGAGSETFGGENWLREVNVGGYVQEQVGYRDFAFVTLGARFDKTSAFGESVGTAFYPKASLSVVPSDTGGWGSSKMSTLRLRAAIGQSGLQPGAFDKFTTYAPFNSEGGAAVLPDNLGNPNLEPEVSTEWELGAELALFDDRAAIDLTYWSRRVKDALVERQFPISGGFRAAQLDNIGELEAWGVDVQLEGTVFESDDVSLRMFANGAFMRETVVDLGGAPPLKIGGSYQRFRGFVREGYAPGAFFGAKLQDVAIPLDLFATCTAPSRQEALEYFSQPRFPLEFEVLAVGCGDSEAIRDQYLGKPTPDWQGALGFDLTVFGLDLTSLFEYRWGNWVAQDLTGAFRRASPGLGMNTPEAARVHATLMNPESTAEHRLDAALVWARELRSLSPMSGLNQMYSADFLRWRELSLTYRTPEGLASRVGAQSLAFTLAARNLHIWIDREYPGIDPESNVLSRCTDDSIDCNFQFATEAMGIPIPRRFSVAVRAVF